MPANIELQDVMEQLDRPHDTSMSLWFAYWRARIVLRQVALARYKRVLERYEEQGIDPSFPIDVSEGQQEISNDHTPSMVTVQDELKYPEVEDAMRNLQEQEMRKLQAEVDLDKWYSAVKRKK